MDASSRLTAPLLMVGASLLFSAMAVCVKFAALAGHGAGEIVFYRSAVGLVAMAAVMQVGGITWRTAVPGLHLTRSLSGTAGLCLWFYAIGGLPLATAMTLNFMSSVWIALFLIGGAVLLAPRAPGQPGAPGLDPRLVAAVAAGFVGVVLVLRPTLARDQLWHGLVGLLSGMVAAVAYLQVTALGRAGEPGTRVVAYFSLAGVVSGALLTLLEGGPLLPSPRTAALLLATGLLATAGQWMMTRAYAVGATLGNAALQYLGIVWSFGLGVALFDDPVSAMALAGMALIVAAGIVATRLAAAQKPAPPPETRSET